MRLGLPRGKKTNRSSGRSHSVCLRPAIATCLAMRSRSSSVLSTQPGGRLIQYQLTVFCLKPMRRSGLEMYSQ